MAVCGNPTRYCGADEDGDAAERTERGHLWLGPNRQPIVSTDHYQGLITVPDTFDRLKAAVADLYKIERQLGVGGMATRG